MYLDSEKDEDETVTFLEINSSSPLEDDSSNERV